MLFADTSVVVGLYVPQAMSEAAQAVFQGDEPIGISALTEVEFASAVSKLYRVKAINRADAAKVMTAFEAHVTDQLFSFLPLTQALFRRAHGWLASFKTPLRTIDALQMATACAHEATFLTADKALVKTGRQVGAAVRALSCAAPGRQAIPRTPRAWRRR